MLAIRCYTRFSPIQGLVVRKDVEAVPPDVYDLFEDWYGKSWGSQKLLRNFIIDDAEPPVNEIELW